MTLMDRTDTEYVRGLLDAWRAAQAVNMDCVQRLEAPGADFAPGEEAYLIGAGMSAARLMITLGRKIDRQRARDILEERSLG